MKAKVNKHHSKVCYKYASKEGKETFAASVVKFGWLSYCWTQWVFSAYCLLGYSNKAGSREVFKSGHVHERHQTNMTSSEYFRVENRMFFGCLV